MIAAFCKYSGSPPMSVAITGVAFAIALVTILLPETGLRYTANVNILLCIFVSNERSLNLPPQTTQSLTPNSRMS